MKDIVDSLGQVHKLVPVEVGFNSVCNQCSMFDYSTGRCNPLVKHNDDCICLDTGDDNTTYVYKIDGSTLIFG